MTAGKGSLETIAVVPDPLVETEPAAEYFTTSVDDHAPPD